MSCDQEKKNRQGEKIGKGKMGVLQKGKIGRTGATVA